MSDPSLKITASSVTIRCTCGEEIEFDDIHDGSSHSYPCEDCGKRVSVQIDSIVQVESADPKGATHG